MPILLAAGCATPPPCLCPPPPKPAVDARYEPVEFSALPGWSSAPLAASVRAFIAGCARASVAQAMQDACEAAKALPAGDDAAARAFFEKFFAAYAIVAPDGAVEGTITGYYE
ncbi:MAG: hypothetical protein ABI423_13785, partial [Burkholderiales bacterium]